MARMISEFVEMDLPDCNKGQCTNKAFKDHWDCFWHDMSIENVGAEGFWSATSKGELRPLGLTLCLALEKGSPKLCEHTCNRTVWPNLKLKLTRNKAGGGGDREHYITWHLQNCLLVKFVERNSEDYDGDGIVDHVVEITVLPEKISVKHEVDGIAGAFSFKDMSSK